MTDQGLREWSFDPGAYSAMCRSWHLERQALPDAFERYRLARGVEDESKIRAALEEMPRYWTSLRDSGLGAMFEEFLDEHEDLHERLLDPVQRRALRTAIQEENPPPAASPFPIRPPAGAFADPQPSPPLPAASEVLPSLPGEPEPEGSDPAMAPEQPAEPFPDLPPSPPLPLEPEPVPGPRAPDASDSSGDQERCAGSAQTEPSLEPPALVPVPLTPDDGTQEQSLEAPPLLPVSSAAAEADDPGGSGIEPEPKPAVEAPEPEPEPEPGPFAEPPIGELASRYNGDRVVLNWSSENGSVRIRRIILRGDPNAGGELGIAPGIREAHDGADLEPGTLVRYELQRTRGDEISPQVLASEPLLLFKPLRDVEALEGDGEIQLLWRGAEGAERVAVARLESDQEPHVFPQPVSPVTDEGLENGRLYTYVLRALHRDADGGIQCCDEARRPIRPIPAPQPPRDVEITYQKLVAPELPRVATVHYPTPRIGNVSVYVARKEPAWPAGTAVSREDLDSLEGPLPAADPGRPGRSGVLFEAKRFGATYFLPVAELGLHRVVGMSVLGLDCEVFRNVKSLEGTPGRAESPGRDLPNALQMTWDWPSGSDRVRVLWRYDEPPVDGEDPAAEVVVVGLGEFMKQRRSFSIPLPDGTGKACVLLQAGVPFTFQGEQQVFFVPRHGRSSRLVWHRGGRAILRYRIDVRQGYSATSAPESAELILESEGASRPLPEIVLLSAERRKPLRSEIADPFLTAMAIEAEESPRFPIRRQIPLDHVSAYRRYNLVFRDPSCYDTWEIKSLEDSAPRTGTAPLF